MPHSLEAAVAKKSEPRETEMQWLEEDKETVSKYGGEWIAVEGSRLVSHSSSFADVLEAIRRKGIRIQFVILTGRGRLSLKFVLRLFPSQGRRY